MAMKNRVAKEGLAYPKPSVEGGSGLIGVAVPAPPRLSKDTIRRIKAVLDKDERTPMPAAQDSNLVSFATT